MAARRGAARRGANSMYEIQQPGVVSAAVPIRRRAEAVGQDSTALRELARRLQNA